ncbi:chromosome partition protein MukB [Pendulispora albinea]|uniref:Chromosome partition protein MukB n=1 Tax=Pendulispora albinea TaxID=2741071 RepID=A0ABZ2LSS7_9BACT
MMRARATALALVNWKGVFYERYLFDRHVTALEGANGAGKTTVMIAAYVVLLPDLARLRFTNLGESSATGGDRGIWGRLGELGRPSYAALEIEVGPRKFIAGVHLERKAEPTIVLTPFLIKDLDLQGSLKELLLLTRDEHDEVPEIQEVRAKVGRLSGKIDVFSTAKEYFAALFEHGITPLRLATDEDRNKLNEMLKTSMTGGISRALTSELRSFLLKEETGLSDTLSRMRGNLDACHRTRTEVSEARHLEGEISSIYDAGQAMFAAALFATREREKEALGRANEARAQEADALGHLRALDLEIAEGKQKHELLAARLAEMKRVAEEAELHASKIVRAQSVSRRLAELTTELARKEEQARTTRARYDLATEARAVRRLERDRARDAYDRAATGVGDLEKGLEELHRNAHAHRRVRSLLEEARTALAEPSLDEDTVAPALERTKARINAIDHERSRIDRDFETIEVRQGEYDRALRALSALASTGAGHAAGRLPAEASDHDRARAVLSYFGERKASVERAADSQAEAARAGQLAERQAKAKARALELEVEIAGDAEAPSALVQRRLDEAEAELRSAEDDLRAETARISEAQRTRASLQARSAELTARAEKWRDCVPRLEALEKRLGVPLRSGEAIAGARVRLAQDGDRERAALSELKERHAARLREASALEAAGGSFDAELMNLRDELDAELLASRFEEVDPEDAAALQARLGSLENALIVDDPQAAAAKLAKYPRAARSVFLVGAHVALGLDEKKPVRQGDDVFVEEPFGIRVTRVPAHPSLGRRARERRAQELREEAARLEAECEAALGRVRALDESKRDADDLALEWAIIEAGDPRAELERAEREAIEQGEIEHTSRARARSARERADTLRARIASLRALLGDAYLLGPPDYAARAAELAAARESLERSRDELRRTEGDRRVLAELLDALRNPPVRGEERTALEARRRELDVERDRHFAAVSALTEVVDNRHALRFSDAERALAEQRTIVPALEEQRANARTAWEAEERALRGADEAWELAASAQQRADAEAMAVRAHHERATGELLAEGIADVSEEAVLEANRRIVEQGAERKAFEREERRLSTEIALLEERRIQSNRAVTAARAHLASVEREASPAREDWSRLERDAQSSGLLQHALTSRAAVAYRGRGSIDLWAEARSKGELLVDRLRTSRGNAESAAHIQATLTGSKGPEGSERSGHVYLEAWLAVRDVLKRCLPAQVADVEDPLEALQRLRDHLSLLEDRLVRQETDLRGASEDVARGIDVRLRRAKSQVRRLNQSLDGIHFGNVVGIRVEMKRIDKMEQILRALREGEVQELLFQTTLPIEEALDEIFRRYGGGGRTGGQRILDYREYIELMVEIQRKSGGADGAPGNWEPASPTRLSTGEAIGVGAALMMVILTEWERDANLLHQKRETGSLRFLFLDEANRLSQDNLGVLFDLCQNLDLQLLIAAPEVARAEGNTTYRLVRRIDDAGREEVVVSGRRVKAEASPEAPAN